MTHLERLAQYVDMASPHTQGPSFRAPMWHTDGNHVNCNFSNTCKCVALVHMSMFWVPINALDLPQNMSLRVQVTLSNKSRGGFAYDSLFYGQSDGVIADCKFEHHELLLTVHIFHWHCMVLHISKLLLNFVVYVVVHIELLCLVCVLWLCMLWVRFRTWLSCMWHTRCMWSAYK